jgi:7-carboxy-7-deazaguanine synthase
VHYDICEIFQSIQGESTFAGLPCVFIRFTGCNLRCRWCDTQYAFEGATRRSLNDIIAAVAEFAPCKLVELTGGEPLLQPHVPSLAGELLALGYTVLVETNGSLDLSTLAKEVRKIIDLKPPSAQPPQNYEEAWKKNLPYMGSSDEIKCVIAHREDFDYCVKKLEAWNLWGKHTILFSAAWGLLREEELVRWILESRLPIRLNLQWHKYIWSPDAKGV